ncbi:unnamed protein product [Acanthoscelides obtectus]|uniref:Uncharacterized protein n=1 Tax=Acanthoscelides obtectus TaxID=200917 RepID=A0A9P0PD63_ACAOB|nr:unnamed protein product [Acanthoscelides obtectus]CAK1661974.1 hypothetical protein AOBTE_LOCUS22911 [Acanthoscelides obtectus]
MIVLLVLAVAMQLCAATQRCPPDYCVDKAFHCPSVSCITGSIIVQMVPEACRCCEGCYNRLNEGDNCADIENDYCDEGLKCVDNICKKA